MNARRDARVRNRTRASAQAHRPGTDWFRVITYTIGGFLIAAFWWLSITVITLLLGA